MNNSGSKLPLRVAIAGLGTVGCGTFELLDANHSLIKPLAARLGALCHEHIDVLGSPLCANRTRRAELLTEPRRLAR